MLLALVSSAFASGGESLVGTWVGVASLIIFVVGYYVIAAEEVYHINKAKPALFIGTFIFMLIG
ncbi:MAG TPA: sodium:proton antiporter, partial [Sulfurospirillum arcachonense]|nr:sodium:proton antiporter [Sulfurospirillum arcachonense]